MKASNKQEFETVWYEHINHIGLMRLSLPEEEAMRLTEMMDEMRKFVKVASKIAFPDKYLCEQCRKCGFWKEDKCTFDGVCEYPVNPAYLKKEEEMLQR